MRLFILSSLVPLTLLSAAPAHAREASEPSAMSDEAKTIYALGFAMGGTVNGMVEGFDLEPDELDALSQGLRDAVEGREAKVDVETWRSNAPELLAARQKARAAPEEQASREWLAEVAGTSGATKLDSGVLLLETKAGEGASPELGDEVVVHHTGRLRDGSVFASSREEGSPDTLLLSTAIACWKEALARMKPGGAAKIWCPPDTAYGHLGSRAFRSRSLIPPGAALEFEVELIEVVSR